MLGNIYSPISQLNVAVKTFIVLSSHSVFGSALGSLALPRCNEWNGKKKNSNRGSLGKTNKKVG